MIDMKMAPPSRSLRTLMTIATAFALLTVIAAPTASAQFHKSQDGKVVRQDIAPAASGQASQQAYANAADGSSSGRPQEDTISQYKFRTQTGGIADVSWNYNKMIEKNDVVWGQAKNHPNGNYTISKVEDSTLIQKTFSQPRTVEEHQKPEEERQPIERRVVQLDANGRPLEVLIYDIRNQLKFRGVLVYDRNGHFREERLFDPAGKLVRTRIQEYDSRGRAKPVKTVIDETAVDSDISLVLTGHESPGTPSVNSSSEHSNASAAGQPPKRSLLRRILPFGK